MLQLLNHVHGPSLDLLQYVAISLALGSSALDPTVQMCLTRAKQRVRITSLSLLETLCSMQPKMHFREVLRCADFQNMRISSTMLFCKCFFICVRTLGMGTFQPCFLIMRFLLSTSPCNPCLPSCSSTYLLDFRWLSLSHRASPLQPQPQQWAPGTPSAPGLQSCLLLGNSGCAGAVFLAVLVLCSI